MADTVALPDYWRLASRLAARHHHCYYYYTKQSVPSVNVLVSRLLERCHPSIHPSIHPAAPATTAANRDGLRANSEQCSCKMRRPLSPTCAEAWHQPSAVQAGGLAVTLAGWCGRVSRGGLPILLLVVGRWSLLSATEVARARYGCYRTRFFQILGCW